MRKMDNGGFALPAVIFMMVIVTLLIAYMVRIQVTQSATTNMRLLGTQAYWAAKSGAEWAAYQIHRSAPGAGCSNATGAMTIDGFQISVGCSSNSYLEGGKNVYLYQIVVLSTSGAAVGSPDYVSRKLTMVLNVES